MVKKKVVRRHSSKNSSKRLVRKHQPNILIKSAPKPKIRRHALINSLAKAKAIHNRTKVDNLELAANIAVKDSSIETPEKVEERIEAKKAEEQKAEPIKAVAEPEISDSAIVQPEPIFADDVKTNIPSVKDGTSTTRGVRTTVLIISTIILTFWVILLAASIVTNVDRTIERNTTVTITEPITINLARYANATGALNNTDSSLIGYLREELVSEERSAVNRTPFYIVDDYGNKVELILNNDEPRTYDLWFKSGVTSEKTYNITGTFKYNQYNKQKYQYDVYIITQQDRPTHVIETTRLENVTIEGRGFRIDVTQGWKKLMGKE